MVRFVYFDHILWLKDYCILGTSNNINILHIPTDKIIATY
jgi:hypothetical protein